MKNVFTASALAFVLIFGVAVLAPSYLMAAEKAPDCAAEKDPAKKAACEKAAAAPKK